MNIPDIGKPRLVILGGGFAGLSLAQGLKGGEFQVVMLDRNNYHTFQPLLYQVATAMLEPESVADSFRKIFKNQKNFYFRMVDVKRVRPEGKVLETSEGELPYDLLVIATGAGTNYYGMADMARNAFSMKDVSEAIAIRQRLFKNFEKAFFVEDPEERDRLMNVIIVGGGATGIEIAGALGELKQFILPADYPDLDLDRMRIHLIEAGDRLLPNMSEKASAIARKALESFGVTIRLNTKIASYDGESAVTPDGEHIPSRLLIWVAGVTGSIPEGLTGATVMSGGRLKVDAVNRVVGYPDIYAIGDVAVMATESRPKGDPMLAPVAIQQARNLARNILGNGDAPFIYKSRGVMATIGRNRAVVEISRISFGGVLAWLTWLFVHLMSLVGFRNKLIAMVNWAWNYFSYDRGLRVIIPTPRKFKGS